ncbi:MAG TPA: hypothetical protein VHZ24_13650 [Pirellulales bacterium]|jgi:hypothetical protein|nr:hypothetical protein [Pirellulales bacterium]
MTQAELDHAVARATGDSVATVRRLGFQLEDLFPEDLDDLEIDEAALDDGPLVFDWDEYAAVPLERYLAAAA